MRAAIRDVEIEPPGLPGILYLPARPLGLIIFAHGGGSSRLSPRNARVAERLSARGFACLLFDLLQPGEAADRRNVFDIPLLAERLRGAVDWARREEETGRLPIGLFGASTGGGAALVAAADAPDDIGAVVSRGGRPDLAGAALPRVAAPTLLVVGGDDVEVLALNRQALAALRCRAELAIVPGATHLFEEPGKLEDVVALSGDWFLEHLPREQPD
ncbi:MAG: dienelactone hydrolase family protein [Methylocystis sp.]|uniref:dienelactone hydrolase family protein n=1 Tax=Methylocystis sp. TaxID=1911079 RepID=UPI003DA35731